MTFLETIFERLQRTPDSMVVSEIREGAAHPVSARELLAMVQQARQFLRARGMKKGDRCAVLASNSVCWKALWLSHCIRGRPRPSWCI
jgi:long-subunit acyl-CoA synthetase (AMP-forming)